MAVVVVGRRPSGVIGPILLRRAGSGLLTVWLVSLLVFLAVHVLPGNAAVSLLGHHTTPEAKRALIRELGLDRSGFYQYWHWISGFVSGHWGHSLLSQQGVSSVVMRHLEASAVLTLFTMLVTVPLAIGAGSWSAVHNGKVFDTATSMLTLCLSAIP